MKRIYCAASLLNVAHVRNLLLAAGIESELRNQYSAGALGDLPFIETWPQLFVADEDELAAQRALQRATSAAPGSPWQCDCGEQLEAQFTSCWHCGKTRASRPD